MESVMAKKLHLTFEPVALQWGEEVPEGTLQFKEGRMGCAMFLFANAAKGRMAAVRAETCGCPGGKAGLGFGDAYREFPGGGLDAFLRFLSTGNGHTEEGRKFGEMFRQYGAAPFAEKYLHGECYRKSPELMMEWYKEMPFREPGGKYLLFTPLRLLSEGSKAEVVIFTVTADQLSALVILANYARPTKENVIIPWAAGCQLIALLPFHEALQEHPRAVVGLTDISARKAVRSLLGKDMLTFAMPWSLYQEMEENATGSFLDGAEFRFLLEH